MLFNSHWNSFFRLKKKGNFLHYTDYNYEKSMIIFISTKNINFF